MKTLVDRRILYRQSQIAQLYRLVMQRCQTFVAHIPRLNATLYMTMRPDSAMKIAPSCARPMRKFSVGWKQTYVSGSLFTMSKSSTDEGVSAAESKRRFEAALRGARIAGPLHKESAAPKP